MKKTLVIIYLTISLSVHAGIIHEYENNCKNSNLGYAKQIESCQEWLNNISDDNGMEKISALYHYTSTQIRYDKDADLSRLEEAYKLAKIENDHAWLVLIGNMLSDEYLFQGKVEQSALLLGEIIGRVGADKNINNTLNYLYLIERYGNSLVMLKKYDEAQAPLQISINHILPVREDGMRNVILLHNYALLLEKSSKYHEAGLFYMRADQLTKKLGLYNPNALQVQKKLY